ncbi:MAG: COG3014 family protein [Planctomycetota bacterium]
MATRSTWPRALALGLLVLLQAGCTVFGDYNEATREAREAFVRGDFATAEVCYREGLDATNDALLYHLEAGLSAHVGRHYPQSFQLFDQAYKQVVAYQDRALVEATDLAQKVGTILVNDKALPYTGELFEQVMLQAYQAKNVFLQGKRAGVITEALRCNDIVDKGRRIYEAELRATEAEQQKRGTKGVDVAGVEAKMREAYAYEGLILNEPEDVYDLKYVRYLTAFLRDAVADRQADYNSALIDMKFVADRFGEVGWVRRDLERLTALSGAPGDAKQMREKWGLSELPADAGSVALFFEAGMAPKKHELKVIFPTFSGAAAFAFPIYVPVPNPVHGAILEVGSQRAETLALTNLEQVAFRYHQDRLPLLIARQIIRIAVKVATQEGGRAVIANNANGLAALAFTVSASVWNVVSEQADLRCWRTLPQTLQATRLYLPPGDYPARLVLLGKGGAQLGAQDLGTVRIAAGKHRMIDARALGRRAYVDVPREPYDG